MLDNNIALNQQTRFREHGNASSSRLPILKAGLSRVYVQLLTTYSNILMLIRLGHAMNGTHG